MRDVSTKKKLHFTDGLEKVEFLCRPFELKLIVPIQFWSFFYLLYNKFLFFAYTFFFCLNIALVPANMARLSFGLCKIFFWFWSLQNFLFFKIVPDPIFVMTVYVTHDDWTHFVVFGPCKIFCFLNRSLQNFAGTKNKFFFYRDQNLNETYLQGRVP